MELIVVEADIIRRRNSESSFYRWDRAFKQR